MTGIEEAIEAAGSQSELARMLTDLGTQTSRQTVNNWVSEGRVPVDRAREVEQLTGVARERLAGLYQ